MTGTMGDDLMVVKEVAGTNIYWPDQEVMTLNNLESGKSYLVKMNEPGYLIFPQPVESTGKPTVGIQKSERLDDFVMSGNSHIIILPTTAFNTIAVGDEICVFTQQGICAGGVVINDLNQNVAIVAFGNDSTNSVTTGFQNNEAFFYTMRRPSTNQWFAFEVTQYDATFPNQGEYENEGLSKILSVDIYPVGINENNASFIRLSPNPATDKVIISGIEKWPVNITILDAKGQAVMSGININTPEIDISFLKDGLYFIHLSGNDFTTVKKLIVK